MASNTHPAQTPIPTHPGHSAEEPVPSRDHVSDTGTGIIKSFVYRFPFGVHFRCGVKGTKIAGDERSFELESGRARKSSN